MFEPPGFRGNTIALVLVDFDDTLVDTAPRFQNARRDLFALLKESGFDESHAQRVHHDQVDPHMRQRFGLGPARMEHAFRQTYEELCQSFGLCVDAAVAERATLLGRAVAGTPPVIDGALNALALLASAVPTVVYTQAGDADYQLHCIEECGVLNVVSRERIRICERKTADQLRLTLWELGIDQPSTAWMIGNSMRSDINPALEVGANAILVEVDDPWEFDLVEPVSDDYHRVRSFHDAVSLLLQLHTQKTSRSLPRS
jgi:putative hydrolase of the HAD superfamily